MSQAILEQLLKISEEASEIIREVYDTPFSVQYKEPKDPVTAADRRANELICTRLQALFPEVPIVAEESDPESFKNFRNGKRIFFVDPLDGTREFVDRNGEFVVMIGLVDGDHPSVGLIQAPARGMVWAGIVGEGAWSIAKDGTRSPIRVSDQRELSKTRLVASRNHRGAEVEKALAVLGVAELIALGSAGLKGVAVARGEADAYVAPLGAGKRWDACAAEAIVTAAGGSFSDGFGKPFDYRAQSLVNDRGMVASNGHLHASLLERLASLKQA